MNVVSSPAIARPRVLLIDANVEIPRRPPRERDFRHEDLRRTGAVADRTPDVVIVDARSPHLDVDTTVRAFKAMRFALAVVVIGTFRSGNRRGDLLEAAPTT